MEPRTTLRAAACSAARLWISPDQPSTARAPRPGGDPPRGNSTATPQRRKVNTARSRRGALPAPRLSFGGRRLGASCTHGETPAHGWGPRIEADLPGARTLAARERAPHGRTADGDRPRNARNGAGAAVRGDVRGAPGRGRELRRPPLVRRPRFQRRDELHPQPRRDLRHRLALQAGRARRGAPPAGGGPLLLRRADPRAARQRCNPQHDPGVQQQHCPRAARPPRSGRRRGAPGATGHERHDPPRRGLHDHRGRHRALLPATGGAPTDQPRGGPGDARPAAAPEHP